MLLFANGGRLRELLYFTYPASPWIFSGIKSSLCVNPDFMISMFHISAKSAQ